MNDKLELLLRQIGMEEQFYPYFEKGVLSKIVGNRSKDTYVFFIELPTNLPVSLYTHFLELLRSTYADFSVNASIEVKDARNDLIPEYYRYFIGLYSKNSPLLEMFLDKPIQIGEKIHIVLNNLAEKMKFDSIRLSLEKDLHTCGFSYAIEVTIDTVRDLETIEEIHKELEAPVIIPEKKKVATPVPETKKRFIPKDYKRPPLISDPENQKVIVGREIDDIPVRLDTVISPGGTVTIEGYIFADPDFRETKTGLHIISLKITDFTDSIYGTLFVHDDEEFNVISKKIKKKTWYKIRAAVKDKDQYNPDISLTIRDINVSEKTSEQKIIDDAPIKRVELHAHTMMSGMDGVTKLDLGKHTCELVEKTIAMGYKGVAITDHSGCQAFPISFGIIKSHNKSIRKGIQAKIEELESKIAEEEDASVKGELERELSVQKELQKDPPIFKGLYGTELTLVDDTVNIVVRPTDDSLLDNTYVVFDTETTGFNAGGADQMIEIGAVKIQNGDIIDRFDELIDPKRHIPDKITELTCITDEMVQGKDNEEEVTKRFLAWAGDLPMVAHNAKFDISFIEMAMKKYNLGTFENTVIDTLELSRTLDQGYTRHGLSALVKRYNVPWEEDAHHRADYDAEGTALVFHKMLKKLEAQKYEKISDLDKLISKDEIYKFGRTFHFNAIALN